MPTTTVASTPGLSSYLKSLKGATIESSIEQLIALLKRRQIRNSRPCAVATTQLFLRVVGEFKGKDVNKLMARIRQVGHRLIAAQPREMVVGNIVRRVLGLVREVAEDETETNMSDAGIGQSQHGIHDDMPSKRPALPSSISTHSPLKYGATQPTDTIPHESDTSTPDHISRPSLLTSHTSYAPSGPNVTSLFGIFSQPDGVSGTSTPLSGYAGSPAVRPSLTATSLARLEGGGTQVKDIKAEVLEGIREMLDELGQADEQIAEFALDHIHSNEIILTHSSSLTVQKFLLKAARKRTFTVVHVEGYPNDSEETHATLLEGGRLKAGESEDEPDERFKPLTAAGITVIMIPDSAVFAIMSRVNKVILATHTVLANGGLVAAAGARIIAKAAKMHQTPVVVLSGVYKLSPIYPFDVDELIEWGDAGAVVPFQNGIFVENIEVRNPVYDYVPADLVDLYITNLGGHPPSYLYRIVADHYNVEDISL